MGPGKKCAWQGPKASSLSSTQNNYISSFHRQRGKKMDFAEQELKIRGRKQLIYIFLIKLMHNLFMGKGKALEN